MKYLFLACSVLLLFITACSLNDYDNYDTPDAIFEGNIVYEGDPIPVGYNSVSFELWQSGFGKETPIDVTVAQDGSFSAKLFSGKYRLVLKEDQGPYLSPTNTETNSDSIMVDLNGNKSSDIEVLPYYMIRNASFSISDRNVSASFEVEKIMDSENGGKPVESVSLYISKTQFVDERTSISSNIVAATEISDMSNININTDVPELTPEQGYIFARVGVKIVDVEDMLFSNVEKIQLN
ncbi:MAG TPA: DUF3823 domain-containing protein [Fodinibius sp.]|nr:DUF3823 domain-containing protein [Fodinibius sp.]